MDINLDIKPAELLETPSEMRNGHISHEDQIEREIYAGKTIDRNSQRD